MDDLLKIRLDELDNDFDDSKAKPAGKYSKDTRVLTINAVKKMRREAFKKAFDEGRRL